jgi:hypothetical protein
MEFETMPPKHFPKSNSTSTVESNDKFINALNKIHHQAVHGRWERREGDAVILKLTHHILKFGQEKQFSFLRKLVEGGVAHQISSLLAYYYTNRCRLRRSGELQRDCQLSLVSALELLMMVSVESLEQIHSIVDAFLSSPLLIPINLAAQPTSLTFWNLLHPRLLPRLVDRLYEM